MGVLGVLVGLTVEVDVGSGELDWVVLEVTGWVAVIYGFLKDSEHISHRSHWLLLCSETRRGRWGVTRSLCRTL